MDFNVRLKTTTCDGRHPTRVGGRHLSVVVGADPKAELYCEVVFWGRTACVAAPPEACNLVADGGGTAQTPPLRPAARTAIRFINTDALRTAARGYCVPGTEKHDS